MRALSSGRRAHQVWKSASLLQSAAWARPFSWTRPVQHKAEDIEVHMHEKRCFMPPYQHHHIKDADEFDQLWKLSVDSPDQFWGEIAESYSWFRPWDRVYSGDLGDGEFKWFEGGELNITVNALDRHIEAGNGDLKAVTYERDDGTHTTYTYIEVLEQVSRIANVLRSAGVAKGDRVTMCSSMIPNLMFSMLACARIGAVHSVVFGGFSSEAVADRLVNCDSKYIITCDAGVRGGKVVQLKSIVDEAIQLASARGLEVKNVFVTHRAGKGVGPSVPGWVEGRDVDLDEAMGAADTTATPEVMGAEDPLFILYTSGSTGAPKGVLHTTGGYMVYAAETFKHVFDHRPGDVHFCSADVGWITGHSYLTYGPLVNGAHTILFEGTPTYPSPSRFWDIIDKHQVTTFYTAPTALRSLMVYGDEPLEGADLSSLRILGSVGEAINPETWMWFFDKIGRRKCPVVDTWWQTETGGILLSPIPGITTLKPGCATRPFFGVKPAILHEDGEECEPDEGGYLTVSQPWPGMMRTVYGDHTRFRDAYLTQFPGRYCSGDGAHTDSDKDTWIMGRTDDVINVSGHRLGTAEVESALVLHSDIMEAAVVGVPHDIKGQGLYCFVTPRLGIEASDELETQLKQLVREQIGPLASPDAIHVAPGLPKTRSGKIMRRVLRKVAAGDSDYGDTSTLADPHVLHQLESTRKLV